jgi:peptidoglycan hydrolase-like protein with peptidoglycan-binding domain
MSYSLTWLPEALRNAGLKVALVPGWETRGRAEMGTVLGVLCHTTVGPRSGNMPSLNTLIEGRSDLPGPLAQLGLGRDGTYYVIAAGRCNHAGAGGWQGISTGNSNFIGIEAENTGRGDDPWPDVQLDAYRRGAAALLKRVGCSAQACAGHKEYALPKGRKSDPDFDMAVFRQSVAALINGVAPVPSLIPANEPGVAAGRPTLRRGATGQLVGEVQRKVGAVEDGHFGGRTEAALRDFQRLHALVPDGIVGPKTWLALDAV